MSLTYGQLKAAIDAKAGEGLTDDTVIRTLEFERHSQADSIEVGYDADNDAIRVIQIG